MTRWLGYHWQAFLQALRQMIGAPAGFLLNALVISVAFALPLLGLTALDNVRPLSARLVTAPEISIFINMTATRDQALSLQTEVERVVRRTGRTAAILFKSRETALAELKQRASLSDALSVLTENPLPDAYVVTLPPFENAAAAAGIDALATQLRGLPRVDHVQVDSIWVQRLAALSQLLETALLLLGAMLAIVVVTVVFNTIRLQVLTQREEIAVSQLVGATNSFIARPFFYAGALLGGLSAAVALGLVAALLFPLNAAVADFARLYASQFVVLPLGFTATCSVLVLGALLGLCGALLSVYRHLLLVRAN